MALTPEERQKIYEEEKARMEIKQELESKKVEPSPEEIKAKAGKFKNGCIGCIGLIFILAGIGWAVGHFGSASNDKMPLSVGETGIIQGGGESTIVFRTEEAMQAFINAQVANDKAGMAEAANALTAFPVKNGTKVLAIANGEHMFDKQIRILEGDHSDEKGWVPSEWAIKAPAK